MPMSGRSHIVSGGGWKDTCVERIKVKAWVMLFSAIGLGGVAVAGSDSLWLYVCIPAGITFVLSLFFSWKRN